MVFIKICGITNEADAEQAARLGANAIGLNFYPRSPRHVSYATAASILQLLPSSVVPVGLFVNEPVDRMFAHAESLKLPALQVHRDCWDVYFGQVEWARRLCLAFPVCDGESLTRIQDYLRTARFTASLPGTILVDAHVPGLHGGTGQVAPWDLLADFKPDVPLILAGGLTPDNVAEAIRRVRPYGVDVASGVEECPGKKDWDKMRRFIDQARGA